MKKKICFLATIILFALALMLFIPNQVFATPSEDAYLMVDNKFLYDASGNAQIETVEGATYDLSTNTLTLDNFDGDLIEAVYMEEGLKIELKNTNKALTIISNKSIEIIGSGNISLSGSMGINAPSVTISDATINIIGNTEEAYCQGIVAEKIKINSGDVTIKDTAEGLFAEEVIINGGNVSITAWDLAVYARNLTIAGGNVTLKSSNIGIFASTVNFKGGKTVVEGETHAVHAESDIEGTHITLSENMEIEEKATIQTGKFNPFDDVWVYVTTFGTDEIVVDLPNMQILNALKKVTIKEKEIVDDDLLEEGIIGTPPEQEPSTSIPPESENIDKGAKDETPKTGNVAQDTATIWYASIALILVFAIVTIKSKIKK